VKLDPSKLAQIADRLGYMSMRLEGLEALREPVARADAWDGTKHPRGPDGKFVSLGGGGGASHTHDAIENFVVGLKGKKGSAAALIKYLIKEKVPENEIFAAAKHMYGLTDDKKGYIKWYHNDLKKSGEEVPDLVKGGDHLSEGEVKAAVEAKPETLDETTLSWKGDIEGIAPLDSDNDDMQDAYLITQNIDSTLAYKIKALTELREAHGHDSDVGQYAKKLLDAIDPKAAERGLNEYYAGTGISPSEIAAPTELPEPENDTQKGIHGILQNALNGNAAFTPSDFVNDYGNYKTPNAADQPYLDKAVEIAKAAAAGKTEETAKARASSDKKMPTNLDQLKQVGGKLGSNDGAQYVDADGQRYYVKFQKSAEHAANEVLASKLYQAAGAPAADVSMIATPDGKPATISRWLDGGQPGKNPEKFNPSSPEEVASVQKNFGTHAWLGNWDAVGLNHDNQAKPPGADGHYTVDVGGSMKYRAQGAAKDFGAETKEFDTMRDPKQAPQAGPIYNKMSPEEVLTSVNKGPGALSPEDITKLVDQYGPGDASQKAELAKTLIARRRDLLDKAKKAAGVSEAKEEPIAETPVDPKSPYPTPDPKDEGQKDLFLIATDPDEPFETKIGMLQDVEDFMFSPETLKYKDELLKHLEAKMYAKPEASASEGGSTEAGEIPAPDQDSEVQTELYHSVADFEDVSAEEKISLLNDADDFGWTADEIAYKEQLVKHLEAKMYAKPEAPGSRELPAENAPSFLPEPANPTQTGIKAALEEALKNDGYSPSMFIQDYSKATSSGEDKAFIDKALEIAKAADAKPEASAPEEDVEAAQKAWKPEKASIHEDIDSYVNDPKTSDEDKIKYLNAVTLGYGSNAQKEYAAAALEKLTGKPYEPVYLKDHSLMDVPGMANLPPPPTPGAAGLWNYTTANIATSLAGKIKSLEFNATPDQAAKQGYSPKAVAWMKAAAEELKKHQGKAKIPTPSGGTAKFINKVKQIGEFAQKDPNATYSALTHLSDLAHKASNAGNKDFATKMYKAIMIGTSPVQSTPAPATSAPPKPKVPKSTPAQPQHALNDAEKKSYQDLKEKWQGILPANKPPVDALTSALDAAMAKPTLEEQKAAVAAISGIAEPKGMGQTSANDFLDKAKHAYGVASDQKKAPATSSLPEGASKLKQNAIYEKAVKAPGKHVETVHILEDAKGDEVRTKLVANTKKVPGDWYAKVTSAYGNSHDAMTQAVDQAMSSYAKVAQADWTSAEKSSLASYRNGAHDDINNALLGKSSMSPSAVAHVNNIKAAIAKTHVPADTPVWRGMRCSLKDLTGFDDPQEAVGRCFEHKNFASVSRNKQTAQNFGQKVMLRFTVPAGTNAAILGGQSPADTGHFEREMVLDSKSMFQVDKVEQVSAGGQASHIVHCTYLGIRQDG